MSPEPQMPMGMVLPMVVRRGRPVRPSPLDSGFRWNDGGFRENDGGFRWNDGCRCPSLGSLRGL